jgi:EmrB/QacA subfamily drug resistance transporter
MRRSIWWTLAVLGIAQCMVVLDATVVNVALPKVQTALSFSASNLTWVISAYTLTFGGFLLLGGRLADLLGRRTVFLAGVGVFTTASLICGLAPGSGVLVAARAAQGLGAALLSPAAFAILTVTYAQGRERNIAMSVWAGLAGIGGTVGIVLGGALVTGLGWEWVFFINVPIGVALVATGGRLLENSRADTHDQARSFDMPGALLATTGTLAIIYGAVRAGPLGWGSSEVLASLIIGLLLLAAFVFAESRAKAPLVPLRLFNLNGLRTSGGALAANGSVFFSLLFLASIFLQQVRGYSAVVVGLQLLPMGVAAVGGATLASAMIERIGIRPLQAAGAVFQAGGLLLLTQLTVTSPYVSVLLPGTLLVGLGITTVMVPAQVAAVTDVRKDDAGSASGLVNASFQIGGGIGLAVINSLSTSRTAHALAAGATHANALTAGLQRGLLIAAVIAGLNVAVGLTSPRLRPTTDHMAEAAAA